MFNFKYQVIEDAQLWIFPPKVHESQQSNSSVEKNWREWANWVNLSHFYTGISVHEIGVPTRWNPEFTTLEITDSSSTLSLNRGASDDNI